MIYVNIFFLILYFSTLVSTHGPCNCTGVAKRDNLTEGDQWTYCGNQIAYSDAVQNKECIANDLYVCFYSNTQKNQVKSRLKKNCTYGEICKIYHSMLTCHKTAICQKSMC
jgi:hypothetical protein